MPPRGFAAGPGWGAALPRKTARVPLGRATMPSAGFPLHRSFSSLRAAEHTGQSARYLRSRVTDAAAPGPPHGAGPPAALPGISHAKSLITHLKDIFGKFGSHFWSQERKTTHLPDQVWISLFVVYRSTRDSEKDL